MGIINGYNTNPDSLYLEGISAQAETIGSVYYVDVNAGNDSNDGKSWQTANKTLAKAIALSNTDIASGATGWASRNKIYYKGDNNEASAETLITLASKCDIIGVGSYDHRPTSFLIGNHVIGAGAYMGCHFYNIGFMSPATGGVIFTVPTTTSGLSFINCEFDGRSTTASTIGIKATAVEQLTIKGCRFIGKFSTATIQLGAGATRALLIADNIIDSGAIGIDVNSSLTSADCQGFIMNNTINAVTVVVKDASGKLMIVGNRAKTSADGVLANTLVFGSGMACDNIITHSAGTSVYPVLVAIPT